MEGGVEEFSDHPSVFQHELLGGLPGEDEREIVSKAGAPPSRKEGQRWLRHSASLSNCGLDLSGEFYRVAPEGVVELDRRRVGATPHYPGRRGGAWLR